MDDSPFIEPLLENLSDEERAALVDLLHKREHHRQVRTEYDRLVVMQLEEGQNPARAEYMASLMTVHVQPASEAEDEARQAVQNLAINIEGLDEVMPMLLPAVSQYIKIPLMLMVLDVEPAKAMKIMANLREFLRKGME